MNPPLPTMLNKEIVLDLELVVKDERAAAIERLKELAEERKRKEEADEPKDVP